MDKYLLLAKNAIERLYDRTCDVVERQAVIDDKNKRTDYKEIIVLEAQKCRISYKNISSSNQSETINNITQEIKLFISPDIKIKEGSKIIVKKGNSIETYKNSGIPAIYDTHQEIVLESFKGWA